MDDDAIFYLKTRGLEEKETQQILSQGFASEVIDQIELAGLRNQLNEWVSKRLNEEFFHG